MLPYCLKCKKMLKLKPNICKHEKRKSNDFIKLCDFWQ